MGFLLFERFLRVYTFCVGLMEIIVGIAGTIAASNVLSNASNVLVITSSVTVNSYSWSSLWLSLFHIIFGLFLVADESGYVPIVRGYMAFLRSSKVKGAIFIFLGLLVLGLADSLGFAFGILIMINGVLHIVLGRDTFAWRQYTTTTTRTTTTESSDKQRSADFISNAH